MPNSLIRRAKADELTRIILITRRAYNIPYKADTPVTKPHEPANLAEKFKNKEFGIIVAIVNNNLVGAIKYRIIDNHVLYFYQLAVLKKFRYKNIGSSLINRIEKIAKNKKCDIISLDCAQEKKLTDFYKKFGFKIDYIKKHLDHHDVYMSKEVK